MPELAMGVFILLKIVLLADYVNAPVCCCQLQMYGFLTVVRCPAYMGSVQVCLLGNLDPSQNAESVYAGSNLKISCTLHLPFRDEI